MVARSLVSRGVSDTWDPARYEQFKEERTQPFWDLLDLVEPHPGSRAIDLGCGPGELTRELHRHLEAAETVGVDRSEAMLARAEAFAGDGVTFERGDMASWLGEGRYDVVFSNAALHWLDDHERVFSLLADMLAPGGQLAVQMPSNFDHSSHVSAREIAAEEPFRSALDGYAGVESVLPPERYAELLDGLGAEAQQVRLQVYGHHLESAESVIEWVRGTMLTDYQRRLGDPLFEDFLARYRERLLPRLGAGPVFFTFKRLLLWARA